MGILTWVEGDTSITVRVMRQLTSLRREVGSWVFLIVDPGAGVIGPPGDRAQPTQERDHQFLRYQPLGCPPFLS